MMCSTSKLSNIYPKLVALFKYSFAAFRDEVVKSLGKSSHPLAEVLKTEVNTGK